MSFGFSVGDFVTCAQVAWVVYKQLRDAPDEIKAVSDDVGLLHMTLTSMNDNVVQSTALNPHDVEGIAITMDRCRSVLAELQPLADKYGNKRLGLRNRVKFKFEDLESIRKKLKLALDGLNSFNNAVSLSLSVKNDVSQQAILKALARVQADVQAGKRESSTISQIVHDGVKSDDLMVVEEILQELEREGISKKEIRENKPTIAFWIMRGLRNGEWQEFPPETLPSYFTMPVRPSGSSQITLTHQCKIEVLSATYGAMNVTNQMRQFFMTNVSASTKTRVFSVTNEFFGRDPNSGLKVFTMVWRKRLSWDVRASYSYSEPKTFLAPEYEQATFWYDWDAPPVNPETYSTSGLNILSATFHTQDVTSIVARLIKDPIKISNALFGDPAVGVKKTLAVTYCYGLPNNITDCHVEIYKEGAELYIPPPLKIAAASFATTDITDTLRAQVTDDQQLVINLKHQLCHPDPAFGVHKTLAVMFQYGDEPLQMVVGWESDDILTIKPSGSPQRNFMNPIPPRPDDSFHVLGAVWGVQPLYLRHFGLMQQRQEFPCTNEWFGFDGRPNERKTCQLFVWSSAHGAVRCITAWEGETLNIGDSNWYGLSLPHYSELPEDEQLSKGLMTATLSEATPDESNDSAT